MPVSAPGLSAVPAQPHGRALPPRDPETNRRLTEEAGLEIVCDELETMVEPEGEVRWHWLLARLPSRT